MSNNKNKNAYKHWRKNNKTAKPDVAPISANEKSDYLDMYKIHKNLGIPYLTWKIFFDDEEYKVNSDTVKKIQAAENFIQRQENFSVLTSFNEISYNIDFNYINNDDIFMTDWNTFKNDIQNSPSYTINCFKVAIYQKIFNDMPEEQIKHLMSSVSTLPTVNLKLLNYYPIINLRDLKVNSYGKLISTKGCVVRVGHVQHLAQWFVFYCTKCGTQKVVKQSKGLYTLPRKCDLCGVSKFLPILESPYGKTISFQIIRIQEIRTDEQEDKGRMPRILDVELIDDLTNSCMPGDDITLTGIIRIQNNDENNTKKNTASAVSLYMEAISINNSKTRKQNKVVLDSDMDTNDYVAIREVYKEENKFALFVNSLCPGIYGHELVKAGLILSLFGGNPDHSNVRDDIHVLLLGDPGLGKSQMLQACARVASKGVFVCGNSSTSSGLTVTLTKETGSNDFALEPGALVLADHGCCCIDEFDKMSNQHQALLEAMEQQSVSVAKSGVLCSLPARTSILAAANPIGGRYDRSKSVMANLNMSQPLLSRFDLIYLLLDDPDKQLDSRLCKHVMTFHNIKNKSGKTKINNASSEEYTVTLKEKLTCSLDKLISQSLLRKYITYAHQYVKPILSSEAAKVLQDYYLELRSNQVGFAGLPIFNRQLEAMIRLTEARAKLDLRVEANDTDAMEVVEILRYSIMSSNITSFLPNLSLLDTGKCTNKKAKQFILLLSNDVSVNEKDTFSVSELKQISSIAGIALNEFSTLLSKLNNQGILLKSTGNLYKFIPP